MSTNIDNTLPSGSRKRRRTAVVCNECRRRKIACDRKLPCGQCIQYNSTCMYHSTKLLPRGATQPSLVAAANTYTLPPSSTTLDTFRSAEAPPSARLADDLLAPPSTVNNASGVVPLVHTQTPNLPVVHATATLQISPILGTDTAPQEQNPTSMKTQASRQSQAASSPTTQSCTQPSLNGRFIKSRLFGRSHWMNSCIQFEELNGLNNALFDKTSEVYSLLEKCKHLARVLKATKSSTPSIAIEFWQYVPPREIAHQLVQLYLQTFETIFRVLHVPTFQQECVQYWNNPQGASEFFVIKLLLTMAIGTSFYQGPDNTDYSLHDSASLWITATQKWLSAPFGKRRLNLSGVQIYCLMLLARQTNAAGSDFTWITAGSLVRTAMTIGLHRDPSHFPNMSVFHSEQRRRLWATVLEIVIQSSLDSGMPPLISSEDFDCTPPSNIDDAQISDVVQTLPPSQPLDIFTQNSTQCALMRSLPLRLKVVKALNGIRSDFSYEDTHRLGTELTDACRSNSHLFKSFLDSRSSISQAKPTAFQIKFLDLLTRRFLLSLHAPFAQKAHDNIIYYFSRRLCLETSLLLLSHLSPPHSHGTRIQGNDDGDDYTRLRIFGCHIFKSVLIHISATICLELIIQVREDSAPATLSSSLSSNNNSNNSNDELYTAARTSIDITYRRILAGETSLKAHIFFACALGQVDAMRAGTSVERGVSDAAKASLEACYAVLEVRAARFAASSSSLSVEREGEGEGEEANGDGGQGRSLALGDFDDDLDEADGEFSSVQNPMIDLDTSSGWLFSNWDNDDAYS